MGLDIVEMVMALEGEFGVKLEDEELRHTQTVGELYDYIGRLVAPDRIRSEGGPYEGELWTRYVDLIERETGVDRARLRPSARFIRDLDLQ
jgi:hypothetical protein